MSSVSFALRSAAATPTSTVSSHISASARPWLKASSAFVKLSVTMTSVFCSTLQPGVVDRAARRRHLPAGDARERLDRPVVLHQQPPRCLVVGAREVDPRVAGPGVGERRDDEVDAARRQERFARGVGARRTMTRLLAAEGVAGEPLRDLDVEAGVLALHVDVTERRRIALDADDPSLSATRCPPEPRQRSASSGPWPGPRRGRRLREPSVAAQNAATATPAVARRILFMHLAPSSSAMVKFVQECGSWSERRRNRLVRSSRGLSSIVLPDRPPRRSRPSSMKITRSPTSRANCISWVTTSIVIPSLARSRITISTSPTSSGSSAEVTSSKSITCGSIIRPARSRPAAAARPRAGAGAGPPSPRARRARAARAPSPRLRSAGAWIRRAASVRLSITVRCGKRLNCWKTIPIRCRTRGHVGALARDLLALEEDPALVRAARAG